MNPMKKRTVLLANVGVWIAAMTSATAVAYAANRSASLPPPATGTALESAIECDTAAVSVSVPQPTVYMPDDTIVGTRPVSEVP